MAFKITSEQGKDRTGELRTSHGLIETPFFMPVATKAAMKHLCHNNECFTDFIKARLGCY